MLGEALLKDTVLLGAALLTAADSLRAQPKYPPGEIPGGGVGSGRGRS
jgi:hypothetical protein